MKYYDIDGNEISLRKLIKKEPEWAYSRIKLSEWIKCVDRLPLIVGNYLVYAHAQSDYARLYGKIAWVFFNSDKKWAFENTFINPTHWKPSPDPPKEP